MKLELTLSTNPAFLQPAVWDRAAEARRHTCHGSCTLPPAGVTLGHRVGDGKERVAQGPRERAPSDV